MVPDFPWMNTSFLRLAYSEPMRAAGTLAPQDGCYDELQGRRAFEGHSEKDHVQLLSVFITITMTILTLSMVVPALP